MKPIIEIEGLCRSFGNHHALDDVDLTLPEGAVLGLIGNNGAGKTTLIRHLLGLLKAQRGSVRVFGEDPGTRPEAVLSRLGYVSEERNLPAWMSIQELLRYYRAFYPQWDPVLAAELLAEFQLDPTQRVRTLSRGQHVRAALTVALAHRPELLVLDEPSSGLDPVVRRDVLAAILRTVADEGRTVLFSSHLLDEVERMSDHLALLHDGRLRTAGPTDVVRGRHSRWTFHLEESASLPTLPGMLVHSCRGTEHTALCQGDRRHLEQAIGQAGLTPVASTQASLEEIFLAHSGQSRS